MQKRPKNIYYFVSLGGKKVPFPHLITLHWSLLISLGQSFQSAFWFLLNVSRLPGAIKHLGNFQHINRRETKAKLKPRKQWQRELLKTRGEAIILKIQRGWIKCYEKEKRERTKEFQEMKNKLFPSENWRTWEPKMRETISIHTTWIFNCDSFTFPIE